MATWRRFWRFPHAEGLQLCNIALAEARKESQVVAALKEAHHEDKGGIG
jgi:hypothetical protein